MKTPNTTARKLNYAMASLTVLMFATLLMTSCQKEELQQPVPTETTPAPMNDQNSLTKLAPVMLFSSIKIDHIAAKSQTASYSVTVYSNGMVTYEGRRNVNIGDTKTFELKHSKLMEINNICAQTNFFELKGGDVFVPDLPSVQTTFTLERRQHIVSDYEGLPAKLAEFRTKVENALEISQYINAPAGSSKAFNVK